MKKITKLSFSQVFPWVLVIGGILGLLASSILTLDKIHLAEDPSFQPSCSISPVVACSPVLASKQATAFGFPNPFLGLAGFAMVWSVGMMLFAGAKNLKKWFWLCFQAGSGFGMLFVSWLIYNSLYEIGKLCIYCMLTWSVVIPIFWTTLTFNLNDKNIKLNSKLHNLIVNNVGKIIVLNYLIVIIMIFLRFSDYWYSLLG